MKKVLTVTIDGIRYHASRPADCRHCFFWKNRKKGCVLGKENCYYLIEPPKGPSKCEGCPYKLAKPCVLVPCYAAKSLAIVPENSRGYYWLIHSLKVQGMDELASNEYQLARQHLTTEEYKELCTSLGDSCE